MPINSEIPAFDALLQGLSTKGLLHGRAELFQGRSFALVFAPQSFSYTYPHDQFSADSSISVHYRAFAEPFKITILKKKDCSHLSEMWNCTVPISYKNSDGSLKVFA